MTLGLFSYNPANAFSRQQYRSLEDYNMTSKLKILRIKNEDNYRDGKKICREDSKKE